MSEPDYDINEASKTHQGVHGGKEYASFDDISPIGEERISRQPRREEDWAEEIARILANLGIRRFVQGEPPIGAVSVSYKDFMKGDVPDLPENRW